MEQHLSVLTQALNKANQSGAFTLNESSLISNSLKAVTHFVEIQKGQQNKKQDSKTESSKKTTD